MTKLHGVFCRLFLVRSFAMAVAVLTGLSLSWQALDAATDQELLNMLGSTDAATRVRAVKGLAQELSLTASEALKKAAADPEPAVRAAACQAIALQWNLLSLKKLADDLQRNQRARGDATQRQENILREAVAALCADKEPSVAENAIKTATKMGFKRLPDAVLSALTNGNAKVRAAAETMAMTVQDARALPALIQSYKQYGPTPSLVKAMATLADVPAIGVLRDILWKSRSATERRLILAAIAGVAYPERTEILRQYLSYGPATDDAAQALAKVDVKVAAETAMEVYRFKRGGATRTVLDVAASCPDEATRLRFLKQVLRQAPPEHRRQAIRLLAKTPTPKVLSLLEQTCHSPFFWKDAAQALVSIGTPKALAIAENVLDNPAKSLGTILKWKVLGPVHDENAQKILKDALARKEQTSYKTAAGQKAWQVCETDDPWGRINLGNFVDAKKKLSAVAVAEVEATSEQTARLGLGGRCTVVVCFNGKRLTNLPLTMRKSTPDISFLTVTVRPGVNRLCILVKGNKGACDLCARILGEDGKPIK